MKPPLILFYDGMPYLRISPPPGPEPARGVEVVAADCLRDAATIDAAALHRAADRVGSEAGTPSMDALAAAGAEFLRTADLTDEFDAPFRPDGPSIGYGIMLGYLAALESGDR